MGVPVYVKIQQYIKSKISSGEWTEDMQIPTDAEFSRQFRCSRITVTTALRELVQDGIVYRVQGKGTFVSKQANARQLYNNSELAHLAVSLDALSIPGEHRCMGCRVEQPSGEVMQKLGLHSGQSVIVIERMKYVDQEPYALEKMYLSHEEFSFVLDNHMENAGLSEIAKISGRIVGQCYVSSSAVLCDEKNAELMSIAVGVPILRFGLDLRDNQDMPLAYEVVFTVGVSNNGGTKKSADESHAM